MISSLRHLASPRALALAALLACAGASAAPPAGPPSDHFTVTGAVTTAKTFDLAALKSLPRVTATVNGTTWAGVSLWALLDKSVVIANDPAVKNDGLGKIVVATGNDGYRVAFSLGELDPAFGNQPDLIAYEADGKPIGPNGFARLIVPNDAKGGRYVSRLVSLQVISAAPVTAPMNPDNAR
jgi:DMSO/TMAO reductase YedYZ molybdopterin-dependent catalytic subunit